MKVTMRRTLRAAHVRMAVCTAVLLMAACSTGRATAQKVSVPSPVVSYSFTSSLVDSVSGSALQYTSNGASVVSSEVSYVSDRCGRNASAVSFAAGGTTYLQSSGVLPAVPVGSAVRTITTWLSCAGWSSNSKGSPIVSWGTTSGHEYLSVLAIATVIATSGVYYDGWYMYWGTSNPLPCAGASASTWVHVAVVYAGGNLAQMYVNGVQASIGEQDDGASSLNTAATPLSIGGGGQAKNAYSGLWQGPLDDVRIYAAALSAQQVAAVYASEATCSISCSLASVAASVAASPLTLSGTCTNATLPAGTNCSVVCAAGAYLQGSAASSCSVNGTLTGNQTCAVCPAGSYCVGGSAAPVACSPGSYCPAGSASSIPCGATFALSSSVGVGSSVPLFSRQNVSWAVGCFADQLSGATSACAATFAVTLRDAGTDTVLATLFSASNYCPTSGVIQAPVNFTSPPNTFGGQAVYVQAAYSSARNTTSVSLIPTLPFTYVCTASEAASVVPVVVSGMQYTGATSGSASSVLQVSALVPFTAGVGQVEFSVNASSVLASAASCFTSTVLLGTSGVSLAACALALPSVPGTYPFTVRFVYQPDYCSAFQAQVQAQVVVLDVAAVAQSVLSEAARAAGAEAQESAALASLVANTTAAEQLLQARIVAEAAQRASGDAALVSALASEASTRNNTDAQLSSSVLLVSSSVSSEVTRAQSAERVLLGNLTALSARVAALEAATPSYVFVGRSSALSVAYPSNKAAGYGIANQLAYTIVMDQQLAAQGSDAITYDNTTGVLTLRAAGAYRLDAFIHLYVPAGLLTASGVGTGVVAWLDASGAPLGPNVLNPSAAGVTQGIPGDDTFVSTIVTVTASQLPLTAKLTLLSMNQKQAQITDASVISVTKLR